MGIALMCGAVALFACLDTSAKYLSAQMSVLLIAAARYIGAFLLTLFVSNPMTNPGLLKSGNFKLQLVRGLLLVGSTVLNFLALHFMQLDEVLSIIFTFPFIVAIVSGPLLGEWLGWRRWSAICFGFAGVLVITRPGFGAIHPAALFSLTATICYGIYAVLTRIVSRTDSNQTSLFYNNAIGALVMLPVIPFVWTMPTGPFVALLLLGIGFLGSVGHFFLIAGHRLAPASVLSPFIYTQLVWVVILGYVVFDHVPNGWTMAGAAMVIGSGLYLLYRERQLGKTTTSDSVVEGPLE
ncbi:DMT family transporter [Pseudolabrys taiwanensis]|uniref:DMT family transporter n=1 Tax=Pseudolabrys taiwanensis TaxID=331696 RepID=A0A346A4Q7_9HYPH|nr:DMT family transporter [Pseudolabrys taiwanensis]AXK84154.1 DMT family transporter [Pseudolabrys taiwanensis]